METRDCNESCNDRYGVLDIPWRVYCKKACSSDGEDWNECRADCKNMCHKAPVLKEYEWSAHLDRSPGSPTKSRKCEKACIRGCAFKFNVTVAELAAAIPKKSPLPVAAAAATAAKQSASAHLEAAARTKANDEPLDISA